MKGVVIDSSNSPSFGNVNNIQSAGNYEFNLIKSKTGNNIELLNTVLKSYDIPNGRVQLIRVPYYEKVITNAILTCLPWDGTKGGVLVLNSQDSVILYSDIDVSGKGFRGGSDPFSNPTPFHCNESQFFYPPNPDLASQKGEGVAEVSASKSFGRGALANGGGGGNSHNSGGGGGGNAGAGGMGGYQYEGVPCNTTVPFDNRGLGGKSLMYTNAENKIFMGGGGGAGQSNNVEGFQGDGGTGSGIVIIIADKLKSNGHKILANGNGAKPCLGGGVGCHEGMGGGGAGGTALLKINSYIDPVSIETVGGKGGDMTTSGFLKVGPGGGGGGGVQWFSVSSLPMNVTPIYSGGQNGVATGYSNDPWGAAPGNNGSNLFNLQLQYSSPIFKPNIDSVRIRDTATTCETFNFTGEGYTNTHPVSSWQWFFGDGGNASTQQTTHTYGAPGTYTVKLVITDINGCKDSISKNVSTSLLIVDAGDADTVCAGNSVTLQGTHTGGASFAWTPAIYLNDANSLNPLATPPSTTMFYLTTTAPSGCSSTDSVEIFVRSSSTLSVETPGPVCEGDSARLNASGGHLYLWSPAGTLDDPQVSNPWAFPLQTTTYSVQITDTVCDNSATLTTNLTIRALPNIMAGKLNDISCSVNESQLRATGGITYLWTPGSTLNDPASSDPVATPLQTTQYFVTGTDGNGCSNKDSVIVNVDMANVSHFLLPTAFTPNGDGLNDCFGTKYWGTVLEIEFSVYNRWGERIFYTRSPDKCWDGRYKNVIQPGGVYVYWIRAKTSCADEVFRKGTVTLIR
jgi:gliding motility-associated-like protein